MQANQLKQVLLDKLISIEDESLLEKVNLLIGNVDLEKKVFKVSQKQREMLSDSETDIDTGDMVSDDELNEDEEKWLNG
jgi:hypothetical protein